MELDNNDITIPIYNCLINWMLYYNAYFPSIDDTMKLDDTIYDNEDMVDLERKHHQNLFLQLSQTLYPTPTPPTQSSLL